ncbi:MAG TPA: SCP2 sterol-binding domain-containing protein, partial [bacterium]|nr:SCP2 sterol-binding domain-containing protein [bacterium]
VADAYPFLSDEWLAEAKRIREEYQGQVEVKGQLIRMNQVVTDVPFGEGVMHAHVDTTTGTMDIDTGHLEDPDVTVELDYETARAIFVEGNAEVGMQAFMAGKIKVQGDMAKLVAMQQQQITPDPKAAHVRQRLREITS